MNYKKRILKILPHLIVFMILVLPALVFAQNKAGGVVPCSGTDCDYAKFLQLVENVLKELVKIGVAITAIVFAWAGWLYMTAGGDQGKISQAHALFVNVLWGFLFALGAWLIVNLIKNSLGAKIS